MKNLIIIASTFLLSACCTPEIRYVTKTEIKVIETPEILLKKCEVSSPPDRFKYVHLTDQEQEKELINYNIRLLGDLNKCNGDKEEIKAFQAKEKVNAEALNKSLAKDTK
jgi:hypothetical protein